MNMRPVLVLALLAMAVGCSRSSQTAAEIYGKAQEAFVNESYEQAMALIPSDAVLREMRADRKLRDQFHLLHAELLALRPDSERGLTMLAQPFAEGTDEELDRQRRRSLGWGLCRTARTMEGRQAGLAVLDAVLAETRPLTSEESNVQLRRGNCLRAMGKLSEAEAVIRSALASARASKDAFAEVQNLTTLGTLCASGERFDEAAAFTREALQVAGRAGLSSRPTMRRALDNLGWLQFELGDYERAIDTLQRFKPARDRERIVNENNQARTLLAMGDFAGAENHYAKALAAARSKGAVDAGDEASVMQGLASLSFRQGKWFEAARWNREALELVARLRRPDLERNGVLMDARIRLAQEDLTGAEPLLRRLLSDKESARQLRWTAHTELALLLARQGRMALAEAEFQRAMGVVEAGQASLTAAEDRISFLSGRMDVYREAMQFLLQQGRANEALRIAERSRARTLRDNSVRQRGRSGIPVLFYWLDEPASHLWVIDPVQGPAYFRLPGAKEIQDLVERHNQFILRARNPLNEGGQEARQLYEMLVKPAAKLLRGKKVMISPDGGLHALNFETLLVPGPDHYWLEDFEISVVPGSTGPPGRGRPQSKQILLAGDARETEAGFVRLRHAGEELDRIGAQFGSKALRGESATPRAVKEALAKNPAYVHFAAHAQANRLRPLESAILLSSDGTSAKLYAREIAEIPSQAYLVTLSACTAAGAKAFRGEGLVGFAWAFLGAGAENVVASLWEVDDASTPQLMAQMYRQLELGRAPGEALREAKLALLRSGTALQKPYFWGAFQHFQQ